MCRNNKQTFTLWVSHVNSNICRNTDTAWPKMICMHLFFEHASVLYLYCESEEIQRSETCTLLWVHRWTNSFTQITHDYQRPCGHCCRSYIHEPFITVFILSVAKTLLLLAEIHCKTSVIQPLINRGSILSEASNWIEYFTFAEMCPRIIQKVLDKTEKTVMLTHSKVRYYCILNICWVSTFLFYAVC